jgi:L-alanine-DL-glutamate epimerase-like enolase superfamily enzyme
MHKSQAVTPVAAECYLLPAPMRVPLKFGSYVTREIYLLRAKITIRDEATGREAAGWGETPLSVAWGWPSSLDYTRRFERIKALACILTEAWAAMDDHGHPLELGHTFLQKILPSILNSENAKNSNEEAMPWLAALITNSAFDLALYDAYGVLHGLPVYQLYSEEHLGSDLASFLKPATGSLVSFQGLRPDAFLLSSPVRQLAAWHLVGGLDPLTGKDLDGNEPDDGYPVTLSDWIQRDGLRCLKVKLRGNDPAWDYQRTVEVGRLALEQGVSWISTDFNCTAPDVETVVETLDRLLREQPEIYARILYVEQPFPYELREHLMDVHPVSARKPLFMDESAHDWETVRLGRSVGWSGVALKTCKTQTSAILTACWAKAHGMPLMVQDLTNPMLAMIPHALLAGHVGTIYGIETNACQYYPEVSRAEAGIHPGLYQRKAGCIDLSSIDGPGFGYRQEQIKRELPPPLARH